MEVRPGYKQTEVGVIPQEWNTPILGELFTFKNGLNKAKEFFGYGTPIVNYMDVYGKRGLSASDIHGRVNVSKEEMKMFEVRKGDVFFTRTSETAEEVGITSVMLDESPTTVFSGFILRARPKDDSLDNQFKKYCFSTYEVRNQITSKTTETTRALTNGRYLSAVAIARPDKLEQRAIAGALSDVEALLGALTQLIAKKRDLKQAAMQQLLTGQTRLPGFSGEWEVKRLGDLGATYGGLTGKTKSDFGVGLAHYITFLNIMNNVVINPEIFEPVRVQSSEKQNQVQKGDLFFNGSSETPEEVGMCSVLQAEVRSVFLNSFCFGFRLNEGTKHNGLFLAYFFRSDKGRGLLYSLAQGATRYNLSKTSLMKLAFALPEPAEQTSVAAILSDMDAEIAALEARLAKALAIKQGMMQELLTGRIRLL